MTGPLPSFLVIGAMKAGTTSIHHYLGEHPDLFLPAVKELNYFRDDTRHRRGIGWYRSQFAAAAPGQVCGEVSPDYTKHPHHQGAPERIAALLPDVKLIYFLRHPVVRMQSMYIHQRAAGRETRPADVALIEDPHYLQVSCYYMQLERYLRHFNPDQILLCSSERLSADREALMSEVHQFIGVGPHAPATPGKQWYRGTERRRHGTLARAAAASAPVRRAFSMLPASARGRVLNLTTAPLPPQAGHISPHTERELIRRLHDDIHRLRAHAPHIVDAWALEAHAPATPPTA
jgi:hypothetical protein